MILKSEQEMHLYASDRESRAYKNYKVLAWEPSVAQVTHLIVIPADYPHLVDFAGKLNFCY